MIDIFPYHLGGSGGPHIEVPPLRSKGHFINNDIRGLAIKKLDMTRGLFYFFISPTRG